MAVAVRTPGGLVPAQDIVEPWRKRIEHARQHRRPFEVQWQINQNFAAGKQWLEYHHASRRMIFPAELKAKLQAGVKLYTADRLTQYVWTAVSVLLEGGDLRPEVRFIREDLESESFARQANQALAYCWESELYADDRLLDLALMVVTYGTAGVRVRFDPTTGPVMIEQAVWVDGKPILDPALAQQAVAASFQGQGPQVEIRPLRGRITLDLLSPWHILTPPGVARERDFPWEIVVRPVPIDQVLAEYPHAEGYIDPQQLGTIDLLDMKEVTEFSLGADDTAGPAVLEDHVLVYTCYESPTRNYPQGHTLTLAGSSLVPLSLQDSLPVREPCGGTWRSGTTYMHWFRRPKTFWSRAPIEPGIGPQRAYNRTRTWQGEIMSRGMPYILVEEGSLKHKPRGMPMEVIELKPGKPPPAPQPGIGPGQWMNQELQICAADIEAGIGIRDVTLGENPTNVTTYSQLALLNENDRRKLTPIVTRFRVAIARMVEDIVYAMRTYWPPGKQIALADRDDGLLEAVTFNASMLPEAYFVRPQKGGTLPRGQAAELQKINDLIGYCINVGVPMTPEWVKRAYDQGMAPELPEMPVDDHREKARWENERMLQGQFPQPVYYDDAQTHIAEHRSLQIQMEIAGRVDMVQMVEQHIQGHMVFVQQEMERQMQLQQQQAEAAAQVEAAAKTQPAGEQTGDRAGRTESG